MQPRLNEIAAWKILNVSLRDKIEEQGVLQAPEGGDTSVVHKD